MYYNRRACSGRVFNLLFFISKYFKYLKTKNEKLKEDVKKNIVKRSWRLNKQNFLSLISGDSEYAEIKESLTLQHLAATHSVNFVCLKSMVFPEWAYLLNDTYLISTYKIANGEAVKI